MDENDIREALKVLRTVRNELVDEALSSNIARDHHLRDAIDLFRVVGCFQEVIDRLEEIVENEEDSN